MTGIWPLIPVAWGAFGAATLASLPLYRRRPVVPQDRAAGHDPQPVGRVQGVPRCATTPESARPAAFQGGAR